MQHQIKINTIRRHLMTMRVVLSFLAARFGERMENLGHLFFHLTVFNKKVGYVEFGLEDEAQADGTIYYRYTDDDKKVRLGEMTFRISNRWLMRRGARRANHLVWQLKDASEIHENLNFHSVSWGNMAHNRTKAQSPYDLSRLPSDEVIAAHHARLKKFQDFMAKWFPSTPERLDSVQRLPTDEEMEERNASLREAQDWLNRFFPAPERPRGFTARETADMIIKRA